MLAERQTAVNADADAAAASDKLVRSLQSQLQTTAELLVALGRTDVVLAVVGQVVGASGSQAVEPGQPAAATAQPGVPRYVVPPATGDLAFGSSHWDRKPAEIHALILKHAGLLTRFLCGLLGEKRRIDQATTLRLWTDAFKMDWQGDLALLPDVWPTADDGLLLAHSRSMYDRLCKRFPLHTEPYRARYDANNNHHDVLFGFDCASSSRLLLIPMRHCWFDLLDFTYPIALARLSIRFGCLDLLRHLDGKYNVLQDWMAKHGPASEYWHRAVDVAAEYGHLDVIQYLFDLGVTGCTKWAIDWAAKNGHLHVVKWLHENLTEGCTKQAMDWAARNGHLHVVIFLHENRTEGCTKQAMDWAAENGHLPVVILLHESRLEGFTTDTMNGAAENGHLHVVKWLHANRTEGCTTHAMDVAAINGHLPVVQWLHENRTEGCTTLAMDKAAGCGRLHVVKWLHENRTEGCTEEAMVNAARNGDLVIVRWLHEMRQEELTSRALDGAAGWRHLDIVKYMHSKGVRASSSAVETAANLCNTEMLRYLLDYGYSVELGALNRAGLPAIATMLLEHLTLDRAQTLLDEAKQRKSKKATINRLESTIKKLQKPRKR